MSPAASTLAPPVSPSFSGCAGCVVCHCHQVTDAAIREAIEETEAVSVAEITLRTRAGGSCKGCHCRIERMLEGLAPSCGRFALCGQCGCIGALCACAAA